MVVVVVVVVVVVGLSAALRKGVRAILREESRRTRIPLPVVTRFGSRLYVEKCLRRVLKTADGGEGCVGARNRKASERL
jgi:hypothetical protein